MADIRYSTTYDVNRTLSDFKEKLKHGYHVIKILENQLETARQNISLLQGQVRLATETINNLKQHYSELDDGVSFVLNHKGGNDISLQSNVKFNSEIEEQSHVFHSRVNDNDRFHGAPQKHYHNDNENVRSPRPIIVVQKGGQVTVSEADNPEKPRSPYAQQLKQVLEALQDDDPNKKHSNSVRISPTQQENSKENSSSHCSCPECVPSKSYMENSSSCGKPGCSCAYPGSHDMHEKVQESLRSRLQDEESSTWKQPLRAEHGQQSSESPSSAKPTVISSSSHGLVHSSEGDAPASYSRHCQGACCSNDHEVSHAYKMVEKGNSVMHYVPSSSPVSVKRESVSSVHSTSLPGHCDDKCKCHAYVSYARYGYQLVESAPGIPQSIQPISPNSTRRVKRPPPPLLPGDEPPHLKYTKVKRIDGSKLTAQKTIADFSKRRFHPYNPRYDLDLLIVPPPIPASELLGVDTCVMETDIKSTASSKEGSVSSSISEDGSTNAELRYVPNNSVHKSRLNSDGDQEVHKYQNEIVSAESDCLSKTDVLNKNTITHDSNGTAGTRLMVKPELVSTTQWSPSHRQDILQSQRGSKFENFHLIHGNHNVKLASAKMSQLDNVLQRAENRCEQNGIGTKLQDTIAKAF